jgi:signal transduction histidine kinase/ActR/RegA family two-component response regulator
MVRGLTAESVMQKYPGTVPANLGLDQARQRLSADFERGLIVLDSKGTPVGLINAHLLLVALQRAGPETPVDQIMRSFPVVLSMRTPLLRCLDVMTLHDFDFLPVVKDGVYRGILSLKDAAHRLTEKYRSKDSDLGDMQKRLNMKDEYLGLISHDIRTPLSVIALSCDYLANPQAPHPLSEDQKSFVARIQKNCDKASDMAKEIMQVLRFEDSNRLQMDICDCRELIQKILVDLDLLASRKCIQFNFQASGEVKCRLDASRIQHVVENLLTNAIKFSPPGSYVTVVLDVEAKGEKDYLKLSVQDQGPGIRESECEKIFERFTQIEDSLKQRHQQGFGLGLAIARKFVELHAGWIEVDGGFGYGATFTVMLPGVVNAARGGKTAVTKQSAPTILVVEDDSDILEYFAEELELLGYNILTATDGEIAHQVFMRHHPDLILSDIRMPNIDGLELLAKVRLENPAIPVVLCSGYYPGLAEDLAHSAYQADHVIQKPVTIDTIQQVIDQSLANAKRSKAS